MTHVVRLFLTPVLLSSAFVLSNCTTTTRLTGRTEYLEGLSAPSSGAPNPRTQNIAMEDTFSFWDDDGTGGPPRITLDLSEQAAYFYRGEHLVGRSLISSGDENHPTPTGSFKVLYKGPDHKSSVYGWILDAEGNVINDNADIRIHKVPKGGKFDPAKMTWYLQFYPAIGMHAGYLPGYPASHGCVRMPEWMAKNFFENASVGTPVTVRR